MAPSNSAAWHLQSGAPTVTVKSAPYTKPGEHEMVVKNHAVAINPVDWILCFSTSSFTFPWLKHPVILGYDLAGEIVEVGPGVERFAVGDRVVSHAVGLTKKYNNSAKGCFQLYTVCVDHVTTKIPDFISYEAASVIPLGLVTAACGLFEKKNLGLQYPSINPQPTGKTVLVWGGSTSVGCNAIQLAVAAGYDVISTCSSRNFQYVKKLGGSLVFDYKSPNVVKSVVHACKGRNMAGALSMGDGGADQCITILGQCQGTRTVAMATFPITQIPSKHFPLVKVIWEFASWSAVAAVKCMIKGVKTGFVTADDLMHDELGPAIFQDFLPKALANGSFVPAPEPMVVGRGLEYIQEALDTNKNGVSAKKVVVSL